MNIAIAGLGHMGSWLARVFAKEHQIAVYDSDPFELKEFENFPNINVVHHVKDFSNFNPDLFINAVSLSNTIAAFRSIVHYLPEKCIICDIASVKGTIPAYYMMEVPFRYVSVHPMFGPTFSNLDALKKENAVIIKESDPEGAEFFRSFFKKLGLRIFEYTFAEHDAMMAYSLTIPFASSLVFAACMSSKAVPGSTFAKHREVARGLLSEDDRLLVEILFNPNSIGQIERITQKLDYLKEIIEHRNYDKIKEFLDSLRSNIA